jgi:hypothetical protein
VRLDLSTAHFLGTVMQACKQMCHKPVPLSGRWCWHLNPRISTEGGVK